MKKILLPLAVMVAILSCKNEATKGKFTLSGDIKNVENQKIYLEELYFSQKNPDVLDTAEIKNGKFQLSAIGKEEGLYRLRLEKETPGFIFINDGSTINFTADIKDTTIAGPVFNTIANKKLKDLLLNIDARRRQLTTTSGSLNELKINKGSDSAMTIKTNELNGQINDFKSFIVKYIDTTSDPIVAMFALGYTRDIDPAQLKTTIPGLLKRFPDNTAVADLVTQYNKLITQQNETQKQPAKKGVPQVGDMAPEITMNDVNGKPFSLSQLKGKYVLVDFWASWCGPCRGENPNVVAAYNRFSSKNFTVVGVSLDEDKAAWQKAIKDDNLTWQHISDLKGWNSAAVALYGFDGIPYNALIDPQGKIIATELRGGLLEAKLEEVLK